MNRKKVFYLCCLVLIINFLIPITTTFSQPSVNSVSGTLSHKGTVVITGSGFGTKSPAAPLYWSDFETGTVNTPGLSTTAIGSGGMGFSYIWDAHVNDANLNIYGDPRSMIRSSSSSIPWPGTPHTRSTKIISGAHVDTLYLARKNSDHILWTVCAPSKSKRWFMMAYYRLGSTTPIADIYTNRTIPPYSIQLDGAVNSTQTTMNITGTHAVKVSHNYSGDTLLMDSEYIHVKGKSGNTITIGRGCDSTGASCTGTGSSHSNGATVYMRGVGWNNKIGSATSIDSSGYDGSHFQSFGLELNAYGTTDWNPFWGGGGALPCSGCTSDPTRLTKDLRTTWGKIETRLYEDANPGKSWTAIDNQVSQNCTCTSGEYWAADDIKCIQIGKYSARAFCQPLSGTSCGDAGSRALDESWVYMDDVYFDNSLSRVILCNNATYANATICEPQIPSSWSSTSITATVNLGKLPASGTAYLFVFDSSNNRNSAGYPVTIGGGGDPSPAPPTNLKIIQ